MGRKDLNIAPRKADQVRLEFRGCIADGLASLSDWKQREIKNALTNVRFPPMDKVRQVGDPDGIDLLAGEEDAEDRINRARLRLRLRILSYSSNSQPEPNP